MSAGAPTVHNTDIDRQNMAQAVEIHALLTRRVPEADIAAAVGCTLARVRAVAAQPTPDTTDQPTPRGSDGPAADPRLPAHTLTLAALLDTATGHDDHRIARLAEHITGDLDTLRQLLAAEQERQQHADRIRAINTRLANLHTGNAARHRRRSDGQVSA